ncbi:MAG: BLUF domain-containing protein [Rhodospirillales bacterium]
MTETNDLRQITYVSTASRLYTDDQVVSLLEQARCNNASLGVTGFMVYADGNIMQIIEGPSERVGKLFNTICRDPRHGSVMRVLDTAADARIFPDWSMGFARRDSLKSVDGVIDLREAHEKLAAKSDTPHVVRQILRSFIANNAVI